MPHPGSCWFTDGLAKLTSRINVSHKRHEDFASIMLTFVLPGQEATPQRYGNSTQQQHGSQGTKKGLHEALLSNQGYLVKLTLWRKYDLYPAVLGTPLLVIVRSNRV